MKLISVKRESDGVMIASRVEVASSILESMKGLLGRNHIGDGVGMWLEPCSGIHTWFMKIAIDVVFIDKEGVVARLAENVRPWRMRFYHGQAVLELAAGKIAETGLKLGDRLIIGASE